jgi:hypothetical protein
MHCRYNYADGKLGFVFARSLVSHDSSWAACLGINASAPAVHTPPTLPRHASAERPLRGGELHRSASCQGTHLSYYTSLEAMQTDMHDRFGDKGFFGLENYYSGWWQLTFARYYL